MMIDRRPGEYQHMLHYTNFTFRWEMGQCKRTWEIMEVKGISIVGLEPTLL